MNNIKETKDMSLTDEQKLSKLNQLGEIIEMDKNNNDGSLSQQMQSFIVGALYMIEECNESWCDNCRVRSALGCLCCDI